MTAFKYISPKRPMYVTKPYEMPASEKARAKARKGGTANLVGTQILTGLKPVGDGRFRGRAFVPKRNIHATATVRQPGNDVMQVQGCVLGGILCDDEKWTRVSS